MSLFRQLQHLISICSRLIHRVTCLIRRYVHSYTGRHSPKGGGVENEMQNMVEGDKEHRNGTRKVDSSFIVLLVVLI